MLRMRLDENAPAAARVRAADCILDRAKDGLESAGTDIRLTALGQTANLNKPPGNHGGN
jgi:hypothetical protein